MQLAKLLHLQGFHITFVNTEHNHRRLVRTGGPEAVKGLPDFHPPVSCIVSDGVMTFGIRAAEILGVQHATFWTASACGFLGYLQFDELIRRGISPLKEAIRTNFGGQVYKIGPLHLLGKEMYEPETESKSISLNLWKEDLKCTEWLDEKEPQSVVYVNYGSMAVMSVLWIIRSDITMGSSAILPTEFLEEIKGRGCLAGWCPQQEVLSHPAVGVFLTHCGWNSAMESVSAGVPMICWPFYAEQQTNCRYACTEWGIGVELSQDVKRNEVVDAVEEMMNGEAGKVMKHKALEWQKKAREAVGVQGSSLDNFMKFLLDYDHKNKYRLAGSI
ncbi:unnamed protein product [Linum tenue]|uniref:anthocyanidin 3-O-glucosyltransferase n=1 Tax=Linum tenue TaxID=586396 RepID=A0AAV0PVH7_9ROSI|nr:unnamed protein product [Linum tenue]